MKNTLVALSLFALVAASNVVAEEVAEVAALEETKVVAQDGVDSLTNADVKAEVEAGQEAAA